MTGIVIDRALRAQCQTFLQGHGAVTPRIWMERMLAMPEMDLPGDEYGAGPTVTALQDQVAGLLGKPAALFFHKAVVGQQAVLFAHRERTGRRLVAVHPQSHIAIDETDAVERLSDIRLARIGPDDAPFTLADLQGIHEPLAAVVVELPLRNAGFRATSWTELVAISQWCRDQGIAFHLDGARLWETQPWYGRTLAEIAALADSVYVSLYKGLGAPGGAIIAGPADLLAMATPWRSRMGGNLYSAFPYILGGLDGLRRFLPRMADYHAHAMALAAALDERDAPRAADRVMCNSFRLVWPVDASALADILAMTARTDRFWAFGRVVPLPVRDYCYTEMVVGEAAMLHAPSALADRFATWLAAARAVSAKAG
ncbi:threonine aldolase family protein [Niveispirillum fermenti]|uniref:threonine aldolase family protein n=1 Tax=Niveispirillum fermenti TaxID=1233113 RepID=UPI003A88EB4E